MLERSSKSLIEQAFREDFRANHLTFMGFGGWGDLVGAKRIVVSYFVGMLQEFNFTDFKLELGSVTGLSFFTRFLTGYIF